MKVAMISRSSLFSVRGGDTTQIVRTSEELGKLGVHAEGALPRAFTGAALTSYARPIIFIT